MLRGGSNKEAILVRSVAATAFPGQPLFVACKHIQRYSWCEAAEALWLRAEMQIQAGLQRRK